ncbi:MAG: putative metal-dependent hydrolase [Candidatus Acidoferrum typicum]|nr:putative metal-dependent hydrolase [Candidatus Acidoferrum typicum]
MLAQLNLGEISVDVVFKDIKNIHLSVYPPTGRVRISAPERMKLDTIRIFAISKLDWIKRQQTKLRGQERETPREYLDRESHYLWGRRYLLRVVEVDAAAGVELAPRTMILKVRPQANEAKKAVIVAEFYREQIRAAVPSLVAKWTALMGVTLHRLYVRQMKTKWGSCNPRSRAIRLNTELAKKPKHCLEYILVHELVHFLEPRHGDRFVSFMDKFMPQWRHYREELNRYPLGHESWKY